MDIRKISLHLSGKTPPYEKYSRFEFFEHLEEIFSYKLDKLEFYWKQAREFEEEFYYLIFDKLNSKSKKDEGEKEKLNLLLKKLALSSDIYNERTNEATKIKPLILTEGKTDVKILKTAWLKLNGINDFNEKNINEKFEEKANFKIENGDLLNGEKLPKSLASANILGNIVYYWKGESQLVGLFDRDDAGFKGFNLIDIRKNEFEEIEDAEGNNIKIKIRSDINYATGLIYPIPVNRNGYEQRDQMKGDGSIEIESYFTDNDIVKLGFKSSIKNMEDDGFKYTKLKITKKESFSNKVIEKHSEIDFSNFEILFDKIYEILD